MFGDLQIAHEHTIDLKYRAIVPLGLSLDCSQTLRKDKAGHGIK